MKNSNEFNILKDSGFTDEQRDGLDSAAVSSYSGTGHTYSDGFIGNLKNTLKKEKRRAELQAANTFVVNQLTGNKRVAFLTEFPDAVFDIEKTLGKRLLKVWLDGLPEEVPNG